MKGNYPGNCYYCGKNLKPGEMVTIPKDWPGVWFGGRCDPLAHVRCDKFPKNKRKVVPVMSRFGTGTWENLVEKFPDLASMKDRFREEGADFSILFRYRKDPQFPDHVVVYQYTGDVGDKNTKKIFGIVPFMKVI
jgi:hypothetical protein